MNICVFCGSSTGSDPAFAELARALGTALVKQRLGLVYGGSSVGLMNIVAETALGEGGAVTGVIPEVLRDLEVAHHGLTKLHVVPGMHERKKLMYELSAGFIALPGGFGTFEEVFEATTWSQLGLHTAEIQKPVVLLDVNGYWRPLIDFLDAAVANGFVKPKNRTLVDYTTSIDEAIDLAKGITA